MSDLARIVVPVCSVCGIPIAEHPNTDACATSERSFGPCRKCGGTEIRVTYHDAKPHCSECAELGRVNPSCKYSDECVGREDEGEHLAVGCQRCRFGWIEAVS